MNVFQRTYYFFSPYVDQRERKVNMFFSRLRETTSSQGVKKQVIDLMQRDVAVINLWTEYRYKGYKYLSKPVRKKLYKNLDLITQDFDTFYKNELERPRVTASLKSSSGHKQRSEQAVLLRTLMKYFSPSRGLYEYRESSSFSRLLRDPASEKLIGDCNQIVTLYIYLYSRYFDISDLCVRLLPNHVALHFDGADIETTTGSVQDYGSHKSAQLQPIEEIVSINLLDTTDTYLKTHSIAPKDFLQSSRFAFMLSHDRDIVTKNLASAYKNMVNILMNRNDYNNARTVAKTSRDIELIAIVGHNGALHYINKHDFTRARKYARDAPQKNVLIKNSYHAEGVHLYNSHHFKQAIKAFERSGDTELLRNCYTSLFFVEQAKLENNMTAESIKKHTATIKLMHTYAKKSHQKKLIDFTQSLQKYL